MKIKPTYQEIEKELKDLKKSCKVNILLDLADVMFIELDTSGIVILVNRKDLKVFGYKENEMLGKNWFENFLPERIKKNIHAFSDKLLNGDTKTVEYVENLILTKNGDERLILWHNTD